MNTKLLFAIGTIVLLNSCSSAHKATQTIDDVYYSPMNGAPAAFVAASTSTNSYNDEALLMSIRDRRWRDFDYDYSYTPYYYGYNSDYYYNPYYCTYPIYSPIIYLPANPVITMPRMTNLSAYNTKYNNSNQAMQQDRTNTLRQQKIYNTNNRQSSAGNFFQQLLSPSGNNNNNSNNNNYNPNAANNVPANNNSSNNANNSNFDNRNYNPPSNNNSSSGGGGSARRH